MFSYDYMLQMLMAEKRQKNKSTQDIDKNKDKASTCFNGQSRFTVQQEKSNNVCAKGTH